MQSRLELIQQTIKLCTDHFANSFARFGALDTKAQGTTTMAGVLLGAALALVPQRLFGFVVVQHRLAATFAISLLLFFAFGAILFSLLALQVKSSRAPFRGEVAATSVRDLLALPADDLSAEIIERYYLNQLDQWQAVLIEMHGKVLTKARFLRAAQFCATAAALSVAIFIWEALRTAVASAGSP